MDLEQTLSLIAERSQKIGDLPIFSASVNRVRKVSTEIDSTAMALSMEVMKDANLSARLLKLANSPFYNRSKGKIRTVSRAVVILGFETIKNLCMTVKLIDSFQSDHPAINMNQMLVNAFVSAGFIRDVAGKAGINDIESSYISGLLHGFGEIIVAYYLPNEYIDMQTLREESDLKYSEIQRERFGATFSVIAQHVAKSWDFPADVIKTMASYNVHSGNKPSKKDMNHALAAIGNCMTANIYGNADDDAPAFSDLVANLAKITGITGKILEGTFVESFKTSCDLAEEYGLHREYLLPEVVESEDSRRDNTARMFAFYVESKAGSGKTKTSHQSAAVEKEKEKEVVAQAKPEQTASAQKISRAPVTAVEAEEETENGGISGQHADPAVQLEIMQEITTLITEQAGVHRVFVKAIEGIHIGVGFDNAVLCLLSSDHRVLSGRIGMGKKSETLKEILTTHTQQSKNLLVQCLVQGNEQLITNASDPGYADILPENFIEKLTTTNFVIAPLRVGAKPVGLFYADKSVSMQPISETEFRGFIQFVKQANLALQYAEMARAAAQKTIA